MLLASTQKSFVILFITRHVYVNTLCHQIKLYCHSALVVHEHVLDDCLDFDIKLGSSPTIVIYELVEKPYVERIQDRLRNLQTCPRISPFHTTKSKKNKQGKLELNEFIPKKYSKN